MITYVIKINNDIEGKRVLLELKQSPSVTSIVKEKLRKDWKVRSRALLNKKEGEGLCQLMKKHETGTLVSKSSILKSLGS